MLVDMGVDPALVTELALLAVFLGTVLPFAPAEPALISGGALAAAGEVSLAAVLAVAVVGSVVCDLITYRGGWAVGPPMLRRGRRGRLSDAVSWTEAQLAAGAGLKLVGLRVIPTGGLVVPMVCGVFRMPVRRFLVISVIGSTAFCVRAATLGFVGGVLADDLYLGLASSLLVALLLTVGASWVTRHQAAPKQTSGAGGEQSEESEESEDPSTDTASASA